MNVFLICVTVEKQCQNHYSSYKQRTPLGALTGYRNFKILRRHSWIRENIIKKLANSQLLKKENRHSKTRDCQNK